MKSWCVIFLLLLSSAISAQNEVKVYTWEEAKNASPDSIFGISFNKMKLTELPEELEKFVHLKILLADKNKLQSVPEYLGNFTELEELSLGKNDFASLPLVICRLPNLKRLILNRNNLIGLPVSIGNLSSLEYLDLYSNPIAGLPTELENLSGTLKELDLTAIRFSFPFQESWQKRLPNTKIHFDPPCDCMN